MNDPDVVEGIFDKTFFQYWKYLQSVQISILDNSSLRTLREIHFVIVEVLLRHNVESSFQIFSSFKSSIILEPLLRTRAQLSC